MKKNNINRVVLVSLIFLLCQCNSQHEEDKIYSIETKLIEQAIHQFKFNNQTSMPFIVVWFNNKVSKNLTFGMHLFLITPYSLKMASSDVSSIIIPSQTTHQINEDFQKIIESACEGANQNYLLIPLDIKIAETMVDLHTIISFDKIHDHPELLKIISTTLGLSDSIRINELKSLIQFCIEGDPS